MGVNEESVYVVCPRCGGDGVDPYPANWGIFTTYVECARCGGAGRLKRR